MSMKLAAALSDHFQSKARETRVKTVTIGLRYKGDKRPRRHGGST